MKTNFFEQVAGMNLPGTLQIHIKAGENGKQTVSVLLLPKEGKNGAALPPMLFKGMPQELDEAFFGQLAEPVQQTTRLFTNLEAYQKSLDKAGKDGKPAKEKPAATNTAKNKEEADTETGGLFAEAPDDTAAKAEKKRLYDEAMQTVEALNAEMRYTDAIAALPNAVDYPDKAAEITAKTGQLQKKQETLERLKAEL